MTFDPAKRAKIKIKPTTNLAAIVRAAGGDTSKALLEDGYLVVQGIDQEALAAAAEPADDLYSARAEVKVIAQAELARRISEGLPFRGKVADMDEQKAIPRITGAVTGALAAQIQNVPLTISWRMADNTSLTLDGPSLISLGQLVLTYFQMLNGHYWSLVDAAESAPDLASIAEIDPMTGWPAPPVEPA